MGRTLRALIVEDSESDAELLLAELALGGFDVMHERVQTAETMKAALENATWDVVLSDYSLSTFSGPAALEVLKAAGLDLPFIIISGTIGEEVAVTALKSGADDFLVKGHLARLLPALERELRDVAARREHTQLEEQLRQAQKMEAIGQLAGGIAHDFNNLLTAILGYSELLRDQLAGTPGAVADLEEITKAGQRAAALTQQLLAFSRKQLLEPQVLDLNQVVAEIEKMLRRIIGEDVRLETTLSPTSAEVRADRSQLDQVLLNLAVNARDAMPRGGTLSLQTGFNTPPDVLVPHGAQRPPNGWVSLVIKDTGSGIPPEVQARMFEPFFTTKGLGKGTGLGLSTVFGIVTQSGGYIGVSSQLGRGTTFTIYLPAVSDSVESTGASGAGLDSSAGTETILVVEDDAGIRELVRKVLTGRGYTVLEAANGAAAMAASDGHKGVIHLLLTDIVMPGVYGPDLAQRIVTRRPAISVLYVSGYTSRFSLDLGALSTGVNFLHKPFTPDSLVKKVRMCLDRPGIETQPPVIRN